MVKRRKGEKMAGLHGFLVCVACETACQSWEGKPSHSKVCPMHPTHPRTRKHSCSDLAAGVVLAVRPVKVLGTAVIVRMHQLMSQSMVDFLLQSAACGRSRRAGTVNCKAAAVLAVWRQQAMKQADGCITRLDLAGVVGAGSDSRQAAGSRLQNGTVTAGEEAARMHAALCPTQC